MLALGVLRKNSFVLVQAAVHGFTERTMILRVLISCRGERVFKDQPQENARLNMVEIQVSFVWETKNSNLRIFAGEFELYCMQIRKRRTWIRRRAVFVS